MPGTNHLKEMMIQMGWNLMEKVKLVPPLNECQTPNHRLVMNIIVWNCRGTLKPNFLAHVRDLVQNHPAIFLVMEIRVGGNRAKEIMDCLPFNGAIHTNTIGYAGGLWLL